MTPQKHKDETGKAKSKKRSDPVSLIKEATALKESPATAFPPDVIELAVDQIATNQAATARNLSRVQLEESQQDLERIRRPAAPMQQSMGLFGQGQSPLIALVEQIPKEDRRQFIEDNKDALFGANGPITGMGANPHLAALLHKDENGGSGNSAASDMAAIMVAMNQVQTENMRMFMELQKFQQPTTKATALDGIEKIMAMTLQQTKAMQESMSSQKEETQAQIYALQQENMQMQRDQLGAQIESMAAQHAEEIQQLRKSIENKEGQITRGDLATLLEQTERVAGVKFSADTAEDARVRNDHMYEMKKLEIEENRATQAHDAQLAAAAAKQQQWSAIAAVAAPFMDVMRLKKAVQSGGSPSARALANRVSD